MTKAMLEYNLPEDQFDYNLAINSFKYYRCITDLAETYRSIIKYNAVDKIRDYLTPELSSTLTDEQLVELAEAFRELYRAAVEQNDAFEIE